VPTPKAGESVERELKGGEAHLYEMSVTANQFVRVVVEQRGIDVIVALVGQDGAKLLEVDRPNGSNGPEELFWIAAGPEKYRLEVRALERDAPAGKYRLKIAEGRQSAEREQKILTAQEALIRGDGLRAQKAPEPDRDAAQSFGDALRLWLEAEESSSAAYAAGQLARTYRDLGDNRKASEAYRQAASLHRAAKDQYGELEALRSLGGFNLSIREDAAALECYQQALALAKAVGSKSVEAATLNDIGIASSNVLGSEKALEYFEQALTLRRSIGDRSGEGVTLYNIADTYWGFKEYQKSLNYGFQALDIFRALGDRFGQAKTLYHIGWVYFSTTENKKAVEYLQQALPLFRALGNRAEELFTLDTLARASANSGNHWKALEYVQQKLPLLKAAGDEAGVAEAESIIGILYSELGEPQKALPYLQSALQLQREARNQREAAITLNGLGWLYYTQGDGQKAAANYRESLSIWKTLRDADWQAKVLYNLAELECIKGDWAEAEKLLTEVLDLEESHLAAGFLSGAEREKKFLLGQNIRSLQLSISVNAQRAPNDPGAARLAMTTLLRRKGRILDSLTEEYAALRRNASAETLALLDGLNQQVSRQTQLKLRRPGDMSPRDHEALINESQAKIEELQSRLKTSSLEYGRQSEKVTLEAVQQNIPEDAALVEFTLWVPFDRAKREVNKFGKPRYVAYVLFGRGNPQLVELGDAVEVSLLAIKLRNLQREPFAGIPEIKRAARELDELIMRPIRGLLGGRTRLLISPENQLNLVPFAALVDDRGQYLVKNYSISYLTSGRDLLRLQHARHANDPPLIIANPDFENTEGRSSGKSLPSAQSRSGLPADAKWSPLPGTESEARAIKNLLPTANLRVGAEATEAEVKRANAPSILHLATHGFFRADIPREKTSLLATLWAALGADDEDAARRENPMLRSGLALAGANQRRSGEEDGVLTALEMAGLNLWGTRLVVLSGCQTGDGDVETGEGVYGLRRAVVLAGAEAQVMSLWKVDDGVTAGLMAEYYTNLLKKNRGRADALREVQLLTLANRNTHHPYYWAGFIESGAWTEVNDLDAPQTRTGKQ